MTSSNEARASEVAIMDNSQLQPRSAHMSGFTDRWRWRHLLSLLLLGAILVVLWRIPGCSWLVYPFRLFGTFVHELSHGMAALATGGSFQRFVVNPDLSGMAWSAGGTRWVVASAGYIGSALCGAVLILLGRFLSARILLFAIGAVLALSCLLFVRNGFGALAGIALAALLILAARYLREPWSEGLLLLIALQTLLDGFGAIIDLFARSLQPGTHTDADTLAQLSGLPAPFWALIWAALSAGIALGVLWLAVRQIKRPAMGSGLPR